MSHFRQGFIGRAVQLQEAAILQPVIFLLPEQATVQALQLLRGKLSGVQVQTEQTVGDGTPHRGSGGPDLLVPQALGDVYLSIAVKGIQHIREKVIHGLLFLHDKYAIAVLLKVPPQRILGSLLLPHIALHRQIPGGREAVRYFLLSIAELQLCL